MEKYEDLPIGIDLGTSFSCIAVYRNSSVEIIPNEIGNRTTPSIVSFLDNEIYVGEQTEYLRLKEPKNKIYAIKRIIGRDFDEKEVQEDIKNFSYIVKNNNGRPQIEVNSNGIKNYSPEEISSKILEKLKKSAEIFLGKTINKVVITVPAYFTERQKQATKNAGEIAGLNVIKIINEPTAASLAYGFGKPQDNDFTKNTNFDDYVNIKEKIDNSNKDDNNKSKVMDCRTNYSAENSFKNETQKIIVFDLGGGTLDVTLLELEKDNIEIKAHSGKMHLGGEDFDNILLNYCIDKFQKKTGINLNDEKYIKQKNRLKEHCIKAKILLSYIDETNIEVESLAEEKDLNIKITRPNFELLCDKKFELCLEPIEDVLKKANEKIDDIDEIILVGGSTKIPKIQNILQKFFNNKKLNKRLNPDEAVAHGAAIEAALIMGKFDENVTLLDVCPFSLGVALHNDNDMDKQNGRLMDKIILRGSKLPIKVTNVFSPAHNFSNSIIIELYEGENKYVKDNYFLGKFRLENLPQKTREKIKINITFEIDEDSILTVRAEEKENNSSNSIVVKNDKGGLSKNEIEEAIQRQKEEIFNQDLGAAFAKERNYKYEIKNLENKIINETQENILFFLNQKLQNTIENFIYTFQNIDTNYTIKEKLYFYLSHLFKVYSNLLNFKNILSKEEKDDIILKIKNYLEIFSKKDTSFLFSLIRKFMGNDDEIFCDFCIQMLSYYSQRGTEYYNNKDRKKAKHYFEEALSINKYFSVEDRVKNNIKQADNLNSIINNCKELINILKAESIEKHSKGFRLGNLILESDFINEEQKLDMLDRFKEGLFYLKNPQRKEDKLLKAIYLANIIKLEYKIFGSNDYDTLLKMIKECIELKEDNYDYRKLSPKDNNKNWYDEISKIKSEIENKKKLIKFNPTIEEDIIKEKLKIEIEQINSKSKEGLIPFFFYILVKHKPYGVEDFNFDTPKDLENSYNSDKKKFMKKIKHIYNPIRYKGNKEEERKNHCIMKEISMIINNFDS